MENSPLKQFQKFLQFTVAGVNYFCNCLINKNTMGINVVQSMLFFKWISGKWREKMKIPSENACNLFKTEL